MRRPSDGLSVTTTASGEDLLGRWPFWRANRGHYPLAEAWAAPGGRAALALCVGERRRVRRCAPDGCGVQLSAVAVDPAHRRGGVARTMVTAVTRWALRRAPAVHLGIWADHDGARRLYAGLGFAVGQEFEGLDPR